MNPWTIIDYSRAGHIEPITAIAGALLLGVLIIELIRYWRARG